MSTWIGKLKTTFFGLATDKSFALDDVEIQQWSKDGKVCVDIFSLNRLMDMLIDNCNEIEKLQAQVEMIDSSQAASARKFIQFRDTTIKTVKRIDAMVDQLARGGGNP